MTSLRKFPAKFRILLRVHFKGFNYFYFILKYERSDCIKYIFVGSSLAGDPTTCPSAL
jgi:hypothetical protein